MTDKNETYVLEETQEEMSFEEKTIIRTAPQDERFTIEQLRAKIVRIEANKASLDVDIAVVQAKIDKATEALGIQEVAKQEELT